MSETRKIAAIMVADIVGYGRLAGTDEDRTLARLRALRSDLIDPTIAVHLGRVVKHTGDGALVEFRSVVDAVRCAVEIQHAMVDDGMAADRRIEFRIGIHLGDVVEEADGDLMGDGVNIAARLEAIAAPGAICLSEQAYWQVKGRLNLVVVDLGPTQLKHIAEPVRVYSLQVDLHPQANPATEAMTPERPLEPKSRSRLTLLGAAIVAVIAIAAGGWRLIVASPPLASAHMSMVVLPFANLSGDPGQDYLADALTDELTTALARLPQTFVIARNTAFTYKGKPADAKTIGKDLDVRYVLEGSLQPSGNQLRVNAQLIDANSGAHLWAEKFDTARTDLLQTQDEIVTRLARALEYQLPVVEAAQLKRTPVTNPGAEDLALRCSGDVFKGVSAGEQSEATWNATWSLCEQALASDPNNVRALTFLAAKFLPRNRGADTRNDLKRADELASKALALDPNYSDAHFVKARVLQSQFRLDEAIAEDRRTLELNPSDVYAYEDIGFAYRRLGEFETSLEHIDKAIRLSPHEPSLASWYADKASAYAALKQYDQAIEWARRAIAISPNNATPHIFLIAALALAGHESESHEALERYLALPDVPSTIGLWRLQRARYVNEHTDLRYVEYWDRLIEGLRKAGMPEE